MIRIVMIVALIAIIIPLGIAVKWGTALLPESASWFLAGVPVGMAIMLALDAWDKRQSADKRGD